MTNWSYLRYVSLLSLVVFACQAAHAQSTDANQVPGSRGWITASMRIPLAKHPDMLDAVPLSVAYTFKKGSYHQIRASIFVSGGRDIGYSNGGQIAGGSVFGAAYHAVVYLGVNFVWQQYQDQWMERPETYPSKFPVFSARLQFSVQVADYVGLGFEVYGFGDSFFGPHAQVGTSMSLIIGHCCGHDKP